MDNEYQFLEASLLPAVTDLLKAVSGMAKNQSDEYEGMRQAITEERRRMDSVEKTVGVLNESVESLIKPLSDLVVAVNESNQLQEKQNRLIADMKELLAQNTKTAESMGMSLEENTARIGVMNLALAKQTEDPGICGLYEQLKEKIGAV